MWSLGDTFQAITVRRDPEVIAFTSPSHASGLLALEPEGEMLLPFEGMGVDTTWELQLPKAANPFDYRTIADVLFTVAYTALQSFTYRQQMIQQLESTLSVERAFSLRDQFADRWYDLHNPAQSTTPMAVRFNTVRADFPPNFEDLRLQHVLLYIVRAAGRTLEIDGVITTRRSNAGSWSALIGGSPVGAWELTLPDTEEMKNHFKNADIEDILLALTCDGRAAAWPA